MRAERKARGRLGDILRASDSEDEEFEPATGELLDDAAARAPVGGAGAVLKYSLRV